jgi:hypothetical protein
MVLGKIYINNPLLYETIRTIYIYRQFPQIAIKQAWMWPPDNIRSSILISSICIFRVI